MGNINNKPVLRFTQFKDSWVNDKMGNLYTFKVTNSFSRENLNYEKGIVKNIHYGDIHTKFQTLFNISKESVPFINPDILIDRIADDNYCKEGDLILADASEDLADVGKSIEVVNLNKEKVLSGLHTILARPTLEKFSIGFSGYLFKSNRVRKQIQKESQGSKVLSISSTRLSNISLVIPSKEEQQKIATFFIFVDSKLQSLKKKKSLLEDYKKGVMQKLFSQELRFKNENRNEFPDWEEKKLGDIAVKRIVKNKDNKINQVFTNSALHGILNQRDYFDKDIANQSNLMSYYLVDKNDFVYNPRISSFAPVGPISRNHIGTGVMSPLYSVFRFKLGNLDFFEYFFSSTVWHKHMEDISNYGARDDRMSFLSSDFYEMPVSFPSIEEQTCIANFLSSIDVKIKAAQFQIDKMETWKKGLFQKMFC